MPTDRAAGEDVRQSGSERSAASPGLPARSKDGNPVRGQHVVAERTFEAIVFDWDGTAVADRRKRTPPQCAPGRGAARGGRRRVRGQRNACRRRGRAAARPPGGTGPAEPVSEPRVGGLRGQRSAEPELVLAATATADEDAQASTAAAAQTVERLVERGLAAAGGIAIG